MGFKIRRFLALGLMLTSLMASTGYATQQSVISYHFGRNVDPSTAAAFVHDDAKFLEYKNQVQPLSDMSPKEYIQNE